MKNISLAILVVGLCFYNGYLVVNGQSMDTMAGLVALIASVTLLLSN